MKPNSTNNNDAAMPESKEGQLTSPPSKNKRATSFIKKKPRLERGLSDHSVLRFNRNANLGESLIIIHFFDHLLNNFKTLTMQMQMSVFLLPKLLPVKNRPDQTLLLIKPLFIT